MWWDDQGATQVGMGRNPFKGMVDCSKTSTWHFPHFPQGFPLHQRQTFYQSRLQMHLILF